MKPLSFVFDTRLTAESITAYRTHSHGLAKTVARLNANWRTADARNAYDRGGLFFIAVRRAAIGCASFCLRVWDDRISRK